MVKKRKIKKIRVALALLILLTVCSGVFYLFQNNKKNKVTEIYGTDSIIIESDTYNVNVRFPTLSNDEFNKGIKAMLDNEIENFKKIAEQADDNSKYELNIGYKIYENENLNSIVFTFYTFIGGAHAEDKQIIYYYDSVKKQVVKWNELFNDKQKALDKLSRLTFEKLKNNKDLILFDDEELKNGLLATEDNFKSLIFDKDKIILNIPPYQVAPYSTGQINLEFKYEELNKNLNYKGGDKSAIEDKENNSNLTRKTRDIESLKNKKVLLMTFDDGPAGKTTIRLLDELAKRDVRVTFFVLGQRIEMYPDIVKRAYQEGHTVASHGYSHKNLTNLSDEALLDELNKTNTLLQNTLGIKNKFIRPPYGSSNSHVFELSNMSFIYWNIDPLDWKYKDANTVYQNIIAGAKDGAISLTHDLYSTSVDGALMAIDDLIRQGYALISLEEAEQLGYININENRSYHSIK